MDLKTTYLGLELEHPLVASAGPLSRTLDGIKQLEDSGAAAVVMFSMFEEQIRHENEMFDHFSKLATESFAESLTFFPSVGEYKLRPDHYLDLLSRAAESTSVPIIASLNGVTNTGWIRYAKDMESAGASALELNVYTVPIDFNLTGKDVENKTLEIVKSVREAISIPLAVKLSPYFSSMAEMAKRVVDAGANGLVLFNRFYQPDIDLAQMEWLSTLHLSTQIEMRLPLLWIAVLKGKLEASLAGSTGVHDPTDAAKYILAGADAVMTTASLIRYGPEHIGELKKGLVEWMEERRYSSVAQMKGSMSQQNINDPSAFARANYLKVLQSYQPSFSN